jgi:hypothetical protein
MIKLGGWTVKTRPGATFAVLLLVLAVSGGVSIFGMRRLSAIAEDIGGNSVPSVLNLGRMVEGVETHRRIRGLQLFGDAAEAQRVQAQAAEAFATIEAG